MDTKQRTEGARSTEQDQLRRVEDLTRQSRELARLQSRLLEAVRRLPDFAGDRNRAAEFRAQAKQLSQQLARSEMRVRDLLAQLAQKDDELERIKNSLGWRLLSHYGPIKHRYIMPLVRIFLRRARRLNPRQSVDARPPELEHPDGGEQAIRYLQWARRCERLRYRRDKVLPLIETFEKAQCISVVMVVSKVPQENVRDAIESVLEQYYSNWELCLGERASAGPAVSELVESFAAGDSRVKVACGEKLTTAAAALNAALRLATGEFVGFLDPNDRMTPDALFEVVAALQESDAELIYCDEDRLDSHGQRCDPVFKPAWSPDLMLSRNYIGRFWICKRRLLDGIEGAREGLVGAENYDLLLRLTERTEKIAHIPKILCHGATEPTIQREEETCRAEGALRALSDALARRKIKGAVEPASANASFRVRRTLTGKNKVTIIIPTRDRVHLLRECVTSIELNTDYENYEVAIVDNGSQEQATLEYLRQTPHRVIRHDGEFNFSAINNRASHEVDGAYLLLLNDDTRVINSEWLSALVEQAQRPEVGAVGARLLYPDGRIQHAGVIVGIEGVADHVGRFVSGFGTDQPLSFSSVIRNYSAVTGACLLIRRRLFSELGGLNEQDLPVSFNDIDLCMRLREEGYLIVYTPYALLYHYESTTGGRAATPRELGYMRSKWFSELLCDPYYNPNLSEFDNQFVCDFSKPESLSCVNVEARAEELIERITVGRSIGQSFSNSAENLSAIGVRIAARPRCVGGTMRLHLRESPHSAYDLLTADLAVSRLRDNEYCTFSFDPVPGSGLTYYFFIELLDAPPDCEYSIWRSVVTDNSVGPYLDGHRPATGTLCFKTYSFQRFRFGHRPRSSRLLRESFSTEPPAETFQVATSEESSEELRLTRSAAEGSWSVDSGVSQRYLSGGDVKGQLLLSRRTDFALSASPAEGIPAAQASSPGFGVNVAGYLSGEFGLGDAIRALVRALEAANVPFVLNNVEVPWHRNLDTTFTHFSDDNPYRVNLIGANSDQAEEFYKLKGRRYFRGKYNIGSWFWELSTFPQDWSSRFRWYNEIWVASKFTAASLSKVSPVPVVKMTYPVCRGSEAVPRDRSRFGLTEGQFVFLFVFDFRSILERKNPLAVIEAFNRAFSRDEDAVLVLKSINSDFDPQGSERLKRASKGARVRIIDAHLGRDEMNSLIAVCDSYVSLHRSEGLGLGMAHAMSLGKPVIATGYSGNMEFMDLNNSLLVRYRLVELDRDFGPYKKGSVWAEPDTAHAAELMRTLYANPQLAVTIGQRAQEDIGRLMDPAVAGKEILERLLLVASA